MADELHVGFLEECFESRSPEVGSVCIGEVLVFLWDTVFLADDEVEQVKKHLRVDIDDPQVELKVATILSEDWLDVGEEQPEHDLEIVLLEHRVVVLQQVDVVHPFTPEILLRKHVHHTVNLECILELRDLDHRKWWL